MSQHPTIDPEEKQSYLRSVVQYWQRRLGLMDWRIKVEWFTLQQVKQKECNGEVHWNSESKSAIITIAEARHHEYIDNKTPVEVTIIHELVHLLWDFLENDGNQMNQTQHNLYEQAIDKTAWALYRERYNFDPHQGDDFQNIWEDE